MSLFNDIFGRKPCPTKEEFRAYVSGGADAATNRKVEEALLGDNPLLEDALEGYRHAGIGALDKAPDFAAFEAGRGGMSKIQRMRPFINTVMAVLLCGIALSGIYAYWNSMTLEDVFSKHFDEFYDPSIYALRSGDADVGQVVYHPYKEAAILAFSKGDCASSLPNWQRYLDEINDGDVQSIMYKGYCSLKVGDAEAAISTLSPIAGKESAYKEESRWYLGLAQMQAGRKEEARATFEDIRGNGHEFYAEKAEDILQYF